MENTFFNDRRNQPKEFDSGLDGNPLLQKGNYGIYASAEKFFFGEPENSSIFFI